MQPVMDFKEQMLLSAAFYTAFDAWSKLSTVASYKSHLNSAFHECCPNAVNKTLECGIKVVEAFGAGISISSNKDFCGSSIWNVKDPTTLKLAGYSVAGLMSTAITITLLGVIGKRIKDQLQLQSIREELSPESGETFKTPTIFKTFGYMVAALGFGSYFMVNLASLDYQRHFANAALNSCCTKVNEISSACIKAVENMYGSGVGVSDLPDLCGSGLKQIVDANRSSLILTSIYCSLFVLVPLIALAKIGYDHCTNKNPTLQHIDSEDSDDLERDTKIQVSD